MHDVRVTNNEATWISMNGPILLDQERIWRKINLSCIMRMFILYTQTAALSIDCHCKTVFVTDLVA
jgi:hypothetical protein